MLNQYPRRHENVETHVERPLNLEEQEVWDVRVEWTNITRKEHEFPDRIVSQAAKVPVENRKEGMSTRTGSCPNVGRNCHQTTRNESTSGP
jgi:hypothetical protein